ncbi:hypothetical protein [Bradyrhizobium sp. BR 10289]|nr:hypothetical protein [Bradyrhizobium sp. BR 10289]
MTGIELSIPDFLAHLQPHARGETDVLGARIGGNADPHDAG